MAIKILLIIVLNFTFLNAISMTDINKNLSKKRINNIERFVKKLNIIKEEINNYIYTYIEDNDKLLNIGHLDNNTVVMNEDKLAETNNLMLIGRSKILNLETLDNQDMKIVISDNYEKIIIREVLSYNNKRFAYIKNKILNSYFYDYDMKMVDYDKDGDTINDYINIEIDLSMKQKNMLRTLTFLNNNNKNIKNYLSNSFSDGRYFVSNNKGDIYVYDIVGGVITEKQSFLTISSETLNHIIIKDETSSDLSAMTMIEKRDFANNMYTDCLTGFEFQLIDRNGTGDVTTFTCSLGKWY